MVVCTAQPSSGPAAPLRRAFRGESAGAGRMQQGRPRVAVRVAPAGSGSGATAAPSLRELKSDLQQAVKDEDYAMAARIRDRIAELEAEDPVSQAEAALAVAVREQRFEDAAALRDRLAELRPPPPPPPPAPAAPAFDPTATTTSDTVTDGIRVVCRSFYVPSESRPATSSYFYGYQITITNEGTETVKLMERFWLITNGQGQSHEVRGPGVVGEQPVLAPGETFTYQSACPLRTPKGTMEGHYELYSKDAAGRWTKSFLVKIGPFALRADV